MLADPLVVTYNGSSKTLPRASRFVPGVAKLLGRSSYGTADGEFVAQSSASLMSDGTTRSEILLGRIQQDDDANPFTGGWTSVPNYFGMVYVCNRYKLNSAVDIPLLRTALGSYLTTSVELKLMNGEL